MRAQKHSPSLPLRDQFIGDPMLCGLAYVSSWHPYPARKPRTQTFQLSSNPFVLLLLFLRWHLRHPSLSLRHLSVSFASKIRFRKWGRFGFQNWFWTRSRARGFRRMSSFWLSMAFRCRIYTRNSIRRSRGTWSWLLIVRVICRWRDPATSVLICRPIRGVEISRKWNSSRVIVTGKRSWNSRGACTWKPLGSVQTWWKVTRSRVWWNVWWITGSVKVRWKVTGPWIWWNVWWTTSSVKVWWKVTGAWVWWHA